MLWQSDVAHWQAGGLGHSTHFNVTTTAMAPRQLLSQPHCRDGPGARSWAECGAAAHARCVAPTLDHFGANSGQKRPGIRPASLGHGAPRERQRHRSVRRTKTAYFSHCVKALSKPRRMSTLPVGVSKCERLFRRLEVGAQPRSARAVHSLHPSDTAARQRGLLVTCHVPQSCPARCSGRPACKLLGGWPSSLLASMAKAWKLEERSHGKHAISFGILAGSHRG